MLSFAQQTVKGIVTDQEHDEEMVPRLLEFKSFCDKLVAHAFVNELPPPPAPSQSHPSSSCTPLPVPPAPRAQPSREFQYGLTDAFAAGFKALRHKPAEISRMVPELA
ncbi:hypothetical protein OH77DRAFT_1525875 [Trametes cingulata]|nr:hypothetical protein OH77DRAFT_1525875 [Trametes cingulata]